jgi:pyridoxal phosphate enzyme (YggS family)
MSDISARARCLLGRIPAHVTLIAVCKGRSTEAVREVVDAGLRDIGQNYMVDARRVAPAIAGIARMHLIGRLRPHDVRAANLKLFDMVQSLDSFEVAVRMDRVAAAIGRDVPVLIEVNSGRERQKSGVAPELAELLVSDVARLSHLQVQGLMTMGPLLGEPEEYRPYFRETRRLFEHLSTAGIPAVTMRHLSMGTSDSYQVAIDEGATMVRIGSALFAPR